MTDDIKLPPLPRDPAPVEVLNDLDDRIINLIKEGLGVAYGG